jgi:hypothetical protein
MAKKRWHPREESSELVFAVCDRFLANMNELFGQAAETAKIAPAKKTMGAAAAVAQWLRKDRDRPDLTREKVYPLLWEAVRRGFLLPKPPRDQNVAKNIAFKYQIERFHHDESSIQVVDVHGQGAHQHVATQAADLVHELVKKLGEKKERVHIGLGPGISARIVAKRLGQLLAYDSDVRALTVHALSSAGLSLDDPDTAPVTFFRFFDDALADVNFVGLFTEAVVRCEDYQHVIEGPSVQASFDKKRDIDIVITAFNAAYGTGHNGQPTDHHCGILGNYLDAWDKQGETRRQLKSAGWVGHVQFLPYSGHGPIQQTAGIRAVVLFELDELVEMTRREDKYVVLMAGPCRQCGMVRSDALLPLLREEALRVWTHLVIDMETAKHVLRPGKATY